MPSLQSLRRKIAAFKNTQKITKAMQMVSAAKLRRAQVAAEAARGVKDIRDSLGEWLPFAIVAALIGAAAFVVWQRVKQRRGGWA